MLMDLATCLKKMELVGVLAFATVDSEGAPQIRNISAIHYEPNALYFFTNWCKKVEMVTATTACTSCTNWTLSFEVSGFRTKTHLLQRHFIFKIT